MKRFLSILAALLLLPTITVHAQKKDLESTQLESFLESYENVDGAMFLSLKGLMLNIAKTSMKDTPAKHLLDEIKRITMFSIEECSKEEKKKFETELKAILKDYMLIEEMKEDDSSVVIYIDKLTDNGFKEMVMHVLTPESTLMVLRGNFTKETIEKIAAEEETPEEKKKK